MSDEIAFKYDQKKNPGSEQHPASIAGVPLRDLTVADLDNMSRDTRRDVAASQMYSATDAGTKIVNADERAIKAEQRAQEQTAEHEGAPAPDASAERSIKRSDGGAKKE
jgi:hypothetical protein